MKYIMGMADVAERLGQEGTVIVDCRFQLGAGNAEAGRRAYEAGHLPGAAYLDLEKDLSALIGAHGGRHPLPDVEELAAKLGRLGIDAATTVIAYDDQGGAMASRLWWLLRYNGHDRAYVMDESFSRWKAAGYPVSVEPVTARQAKTFTPVLRAEMLVTAAEVAAHGRDADVVLIDSRENRRYLGLEEPIDRVAGHIPGAVNRFWKDALDAEGRWKSGEDQASRFVDIPREMEVVVYCGSGVTACPNVIALLEAGFPNVRLYAGSWSDWISYEENPVATGEETKG